MGSFVGRILILQQASAFSCLLVLWRYTFSAIALPLKLQKRTIIVGAGKSGRQLLESIKRHPAGGFLPVGFMDDDPKKQGRVIDGLPVLGNSSQLAEIIEKHQISLLAVAITHGPPGELINRLIKASWKGCELTDMPSITEYLTGKVPTAHISDYWHFQWNLNSSKIYYRCLKRFIDLSLATSFLLLTWPLFALIAILIKWDSPGPIFFKQRRPGLEGVPFNILKFRTMVVNANNYGPQWTQENDPRVTTVGKVLRKSRLDELPQIINIFKGEMSFIGPRPLAHADDNGDIPYYSYRFLVKPGLTGWAQVMYPDGLAIDSTPEKIKYDLYYIKNIGPLLDLAILLKTIRIVLFGRGV
jgi:exopolysaccharide biosynthesis polyprenyl glycosylphosphotransferase